jgi:hypothetical protein
MDPEEPPNKFYGINQQDIETPEDLDDVGKMASETKKAVTACLDVDDDVNRLGIIYNNDLESYCCVYQF